jgi:hypothetical protein
VLITTVLKKLHPCAVKINKVEAPPDTLSSRENCNIIKYLGVP